MNAGGITKKGRELAKKQRDNFGKDLRPAVKQKFGAFGDRYMSYPISRSNQEKT